MSDGAVRKRLQRARESLQSERLAMRRARNPTERNELRRHGIAFGLLMVSFVGMLFWAKHAEWSQAQLLGGSGLYSLAIIAMGVRRARIHCRHRGAS